jgi:hypothetical protein
MQSAQAISAAYYFDLAARDYTLADIRKMAKDKFS